MHCHEGLKLLKPITEEVMYIENGGYIVMCKMINLATYIGENCITLFSCSVPPYWEYLDVGGGTVMKLSEYVGLLKRMICREIQYGRMNMQITIMKLYTICKFPYSTYGIYKCAVTDS